MFMIVILFSGNGNIAILDTEKGETGNNWKYLRQGSNKKLKRWEKSQRSNPSSDDFKTSTREQPLKTLKIEQFKASQSRKEDKIKVKNDVEYFNHKRLL